MRWKSNQSYDIYFSIEFRKNILLERFEVFFLNGFFYSKNCIIWNTEKYPANKLFFQILWKSRCHILITFPSHLKNYVLYWNFDSKSWIVSFFTRFTHEKTKTTFLVKIWSHWPLTCTKLVEIHVLNNHV